MLPFSMNGNGCKNKPNEIFSNEMVKSLNNAFIWL